MMLSRKLFAGCASCVALALVVALLGCSSDRSAGRVAVAFETAGASTPAFYVEVASTPQERARGLMFRKSLGENEGMLFLFPREQPLSFWMKNTFISLDMIFVSSDWRVVGVVKNVPPLTEDRRMVEGASQYVLEFAAGTAERNNIQSGSMVVINGKLPFSQ